MKAIIIDDEIKAQKNLMNLLSEYVENVSVVSCCSSIIEAVNSIKEEKPDVVFLDVEMDNESGFDLFDHFPSPSFDVIFITAHDEYALKAFRKSATDYILKPIDIDDLIEAVEKVRLKRNNDSVQMQEQFQLLVNSLNNKKTMEDKIVLPTMESLIFIMVKEIIRCESLDNYTNFYLDTGKVILVSKNIKHYEEILNEYNFYRVHRSHLVNVDYIKEYYKGEGGYIIMKDGTDIPVSRRKKIPFLNHFSKG